MANLQNIQKRAAALMGFTQKSVGKTEARKQFFPLVDALVEDALAVEITDHDKPVAVLVSYAHYLALATKLCMLTKDQTQQKPASLIGSIKIKASNLESASQDISVKFKNSLQETAGDL